MFPVKNRYDEVFEIEIDGWCFGLTNYPGEISAPVVHRIIRELATSFQAAIDHNVVFNIIQIAGKFSEAARFLIHEQEIAMAIVAQLPNPATLLEEQQCVLGLVIDQVEQAYPGALESFYKRWQIGVKAA
ncbi:MAG: hypothetical protein RL326_886 [Pseudomonadota bacterium]|jgi:hypothetical protein